MDTSPRNRSFGQRERERENEKIKHVGTFCKYALIFLKNDNTTNLHQRFFRNATSVISSVEFENSGTKCVSSN